MFDAYTEMKIRNARFRSGINFRWSSGYMNQTKPQSITKQLGSPNQWNGFLGNIKKASQRFKIITAISGEPFVN